MTTSKVKMKPIGSVNDNLLHRNQNYTEWANTSKVECVNSNIGKVKMKKAEWIIPCYTRLWADPVKWFSPPMKHDTDVTVINHQMVSWPSGGAKDIRVAKPPDKGLDAKELDDDPVLSRPRKCKAVDTGWKIGNEDAPTCAAPLPRPRLLKVELNGEKVHDDKDHMHHDRVP